MTSAQREYLRAVLLRVLPTFLALSAVVFLAKIYILPLVGIFMQPYIWPAVLIVLASITSYGLSGKEAMRVRNEYSERQRFGRGE